LRETVKSHLEYAPSVEALLLSAKANMEVSAVAQTIQSVGLRHDSDVYIINNTESTCYGIIFAVEIICLIKITI
jgi:hypothetical protein